MISGYCKIIVAELRCHSLKRVEKLNIWLATPFRYVNFLCLNMYLKSSAHTIKILLRILNTSKISKVLNLFFYFKTVYSPVLKHNFIVIIMHVLILKII